MAIRQSLFVSLFSLPLALPAFAQTTAVPTAAVPTTAAGLPAGVKLPSPEPAKPLAPLPGVAVPPGMTAAGPLDKASPLDKAAQPPDQGWANDEASYEACMDLARAHPEEGLDAASRWRDRNGGEPAEHCAAEAMMGLKQYDAAARRLEALAADMAAQDEAATKTALASRKVARKTRGHKAPPLPQGRPGLRAAVLAQAADAWNEAGDPHHALDDIAAAFKLAPRDAGLYAARARFEAALGDYRQAQRDLVQALKGPGKNASLYAAKAAADRYLSEVKPALVDAGLAVKLDPTLPEGWLERGNARRLKGDAVGARKDWLQVLTLAPDSSAADAVRDNLARVDVHLPGETASPLKPGDLQPYPVAGMPIPGEPAKTVPGEKRSAKAAHKHKPIAAH